MKDTLEHFKSQIKYYNRFRECAYWGLFTVVIANLFHIPTDYYTVAMELVLSLILVSWTLSRIFAHTAFAQYEAIKAVYGYSDFADEGDNEGGKDND